MQHIANNLPIFSELTITLKKVWIDNMEKDCKFDPWDWIHHECNKGTDLLYIEQFAHFYKSKIAEVKEVFGQFVKYVEKEIVDKSLRTLNIEERQISYYIKSINDLINQKLRMVMTTILNNYIAFIDSFSQPDEPDSEQPVEQEIPEDEHAEVEVELEQQLQPDPESDPNAQL